MRKRGQRRKAVFVMHLFAGSEREEERLACLLTYADTREVEFRHFHHFVSLRGDEEGRKEGRNRSSFSGLSGPFSVGDFQEKRLLLKPQFVCFASSGTTGKERERRGMWSGRDGNLGMWMTTRFLDLTPEEEEEERRGWLEVGRSSEGRIGANLGCGRTKDGTPCAGWKIDLVVIPPSTYLLSSFLQLPAFESLVLLSLPLPLHPTRTASLSTFPSLCLHLPFLHISPSFFLAAQGYAH